jgi:hypothetical protein
LRLIRALAGVKKGRCYCGLGGYEGHDTEEEPCNGKGYPKGSNQSVNASMSKKGVARKRVTKLLRAMGGGK